MAPGVVRRALLGGAPGLRGRTGRAGGRVRVERGAPAEGGYRTSVETSVYVAPDATGAGVGTALYRALFDALDRTDVHRALAGIALPNEASIALHLAFGFRLVGRFTEQGTKFGRFWDVAWYERPMQSRGADRGAVADAEALHAPSGA